jgi:hypothetical protein
MITDTGQITTRPVTALRSLTVVVLAVFDCPYDQELLVIKGVGHTVECPRCHLKYAIKSIKHHIDTKGPQVDVEVGELSAISVPPRNVNIRKVD